MKNNIMLILLTLFFCLWLYTEVTEHDERMAFKKEVKQFMMDHKAEKPHVG